jgi:hypothetical protein
LYRSDKSVTAYTLSDCVDSLKNEEIASVLARERTMTFVVRIYQYLMSGKRMEKTSSWCELGKPHDHSTMSRSQLSYEITTQCSENK